MLLRKLPQCFHWRNSAKNMGTRITGKAVKNHISSKMVRKLTATSNGEPFVVPGITASSSSATPSSASSSSSSQESTSANIQYQTKEVWKLQYQKEVEVRMKSFGETPCMNPQKTETKMKMRKESTKRYIAWIAWLATGIQWEFGWWKYLEELRGNPMQRSAGTSTSSHVLPMEPVEPCPGKHSVLRTFRRIRIVKYTWKPK